MPESSPSCRRGWRSQPRGQSSANSAFSRRRCGTWRSSSTPPHRRATSGRSVAAIAAAAAGAGVLARGRRGLRRLRGQGAAGGQEEPRLLARLPLAVADADRRRGERGPPAIQVEIEKATSLPAEEISAVPKPDDLKLDHVANLARIEPDRRGEGALRRAARRRARLHRAAERGRRRAASSRPRTPFPVVNVWAEDVPGARPVGRGRPAQRAREARQHVRRPEGRRIAPWPRSRSLPAHDRRALPAHGAGRGCPPSS